MCAGGSPDVGYVVAKTTRYNDGYEEKDGPAGHQMSAMSWPKLRDTMMDMRRRMDRLVTRCRLCHGQNCAIQ